MDWKYITSLVPENLTEEEKDELFNTLAWFNTDSETLSLKKCLSFIKITQEILKYKGEQVEILLHKLDELATQQGEEEVRKAESDIELRSRKSSSIEFENLEHKYLELKTKHKKLVRQNEKNKNELAKFQEKIRSLEQEKTRLANELQYANQDETHSDVSESVKEQQKELIDTVHHKNQQISDLLRDIEASEQENVVLREKLTAVRDELAVATKEITELTENFQVAQTEQERLSETVKTLTAENENLQEEMQDLAEQKQQFEQEMEEFAQEVNLRVDEWKVILEEKEKEISDLRLRQIQPSHHSSTSSLVQDDQPQIVTLNKLVNEREKQLLEMKTQLQDAMKEMEESTQTIKKLKQQKSDNESKIANLTESVQELKKQLKSTHERCQDVQSNLDHAEKTIIHKDEDIKEILNQIQEKDLYDVLEQNQALKNQNRLYEKKIMDLAKTCNKLQDSCDFYERENEALKDKLGLSSVDVSSVSTKRKMLKKELERLKKAVQKLEEEKVELKLSLHRKRDEADSKEELKALVEENEALRRGLHEIRQSIKGSTELKSETLEKLLRALDVKHISGWYHPAMRLQAELHNQEGINSELREQLRLARTESHSEKSFEVDLSLAEAITNLDSINGIHQTLQGLFEKLEQESARNEEIHAKLVTYKENFELIRQQIALLYQEYQNEKQNFIDRLSEREERILDLEESNQVNEAQLSLLKEETQDVLVKKSLQLAEDNVVLLRKRTYLENDLKNLNTQIEDLKRELTNTQNQSLKKISDLSKKNASLEVELQSMKNQLELCVNPEDFNTLKGNLEASTIKYRDLLASFTKIEREKENQIRMLEEVCKNLQKEKSELKAKVLSLSEKVYCQCVNKSDELAKKLAQSETNELNEKQRADHTNNLYELVKEQLQKCEERVKQVDKYNGEILQKNLLLQEQLKDAESKLVNFVDDVTFKSLQNRYNELLRKEVKEEKVTVEKVVSSWSDAKEQELLNLKHLIVDLQAASDEKMQIARLSNELANCKQQENCYKEKITVLSQDLDNLHSKYEQLGQEKENVQLNMAEKENELKRKVSVLRELLLKSKLQYLGCVPLPSEEKFVNNIKNAINDKHQAFLHLYNSQIISNESFILKEQYETQLKKLEEILKLNLKDAESIKEIILCHQENKKSHFNEIKYKRQSELKETQLQHVFDRVKIQDEQIIKLEEELFALHKNFSSDLEPESLRHSFDKSDVLKRSFGSQTDVRESEPVRKISKEQQTDDQSAELFNEIAAKEQIIQQLKGKITEHEMNLSLFRKQLGDKQSQITFYERHILELQNKKETTSPEEEILTLKSSLKTFQDDLKEKEEEILRYQSLLKEDRDKHSMAATLMSEELKMLQKSLTEEKAKVAELKSSISSPQPSKAALEQYFMQVHSLEDELSNFRTKVSSLEAQLQASRQEAVRWRVLANDRLETMQKLGQDLEELHRNEIMAYKNEALKWREEVTSLKQMISKYKSDIGLDSDFQKMLKEKDDKIHELSVMVRAVKRRHDKPDAEIKVSELESTKELLLKEHEAIKRRFDQLLVRERSAREEIRELKGKLLKKPILSARSDKSERSIKEQLQKKIAALENENAELKENLARQISINDAHRVKISQDFERWNKQKHFQQLAERFRTKLKAKEGDFEKLQETCAGYRLLIERLEREKYNLETKIRLLRGGTTQQNSAEIEMLKLENTKLMAEIETLTSRLEMQQHHSGGLGAAMLEEKLEAQERKIAVLELSNKCPEKIRGELERLQNSVSTIQKSNLRLEAENLELKLDLEKSTKELPHLREQIQHLESYIEVLKKENVGNVEMVPKTDAKKICELERTIFVLKRVVEKLQAENKRLLTGKRFYPERTGSAERLKRENQRLKEQFSDSVQKISKLEEELKAGDAAELRRELEQKTELLNKVKVLLQRAAMKEKALLQELEELKKSKPVQDLQ